MRITDEESSTRPIAAGHTGRGRIGAAWRTVKRGNRSARGRSSWLPFRISNPVFDSAVMTRRRALGAAVLARARARVRAAGRRSARPGPLRVVLKHHPLGDPAPFRRFLAAFEREHPGVVVSAELLPNAPGAVHQYPADLARGADAGLRRLPRRRHLGRRAGARGVGGRLSARLPRRAHPARLPPGPGQRGAGTGRHLRRALVRGRRGLLLIAPTWSRAPRGRTPSSLDLALSRGRRRTIHGYVWQGLQSEALVCNAYETIWGFGGAPASPDRVELDTPPARDALELMRTLLVSGISPPSVTSMGEEETRRVFQAGAAVFMRNWPYACRRAAGPGSPVRGRVGVAPLPDRARRAGARRARRLPARAQRAHAAVEAGGRARAHRPPDLAGGEPHARRPTTAGCRRAAAPTTTRASPPPRPRVAALLARGGARAPAPGHRRTTRSSTTPSRPSSPRRSPASARPPRRSPARRREVDHLMREVS